MRDILGGFIGSVVVDPWRVLNGLKVKTHEIKCVFRKHTSSHFYDYYAGQLSITFSENK